MSDFQFHTIMAAINIVGSLSAKEFSGRVFCFMLSCFYLILQIYSLYDQSH